MLSESRKLQKKKKDKGTRREKERKKVDKKKRGEKEGMLPFLSI